MDDVLVSIICLTYNHEKFVADALDGFLMQKTSFKYEIIIHDDASLDNTKNIIKSYESKHPEVIKAFFQSVNQYSKGNRRFLKNLLPISKGKYIALCEGDDYWVDPYKLQKQVDYLENHPECSLCVHATYMVSSDKKPMKCHIRPCIGNQIIPAENVISNGKNGYFHTTSLVFPMKHVIELPHFYYMAPVGDYPLSIYLALMGTVYYIDEYMSAYRLSTPGSWTQRIYFNKENYVHHLKKVNLMLDEVNIYSNYQFAAAVLESKQLSNFRILLAQGRYAEAMSGEYERFYKQMRPEDRFKLRIKKNFPEIERLVSLYKTKKI